MSWRWFFVLSQSATHCHTLPHIAPWFRCQSQSDGKMISMAGGDETRVLPSRLMRKWQKLGIILNIANTLAKMRSKDRSVVMESI